ncbi:putative oxalyl-CoA decarboxylase domain protein [Mycobacterium xenopi 3993]|nr:putative oxalyl-CoA decarboxylase domain protein [Mycobacterium xenopi 3993]
MASQPAPDLTDGFHLMVDALKLNRVNTIYGLVGIPITDLARSRRHRAFASSVFGTRPPPATPRPPRGFSPVDPASA